MLKRDDGLLGSRGMLRKRERVLVGKCYALYRPSLNLSEEEYNRRLEEIKMMGNTP